MTDQEVCCSVMEPRPGKGPLECRPWQSVSPGGWWWKRTVNPWEAVWVPRPLTLNECHEIQARLTIDQRSHYCGEIAAINRDALSHLWYGLHADAETKVQALAAALRPLVEGR